MSQPHPRPVRVLQLTKGLGPGGAERLVVTLAQHHDPSRVELHAAYVLSWKQHLVPELEAAGVPATLLGGRRVADLRWLWRLRRLVRDEAIDVVHVHSPLVAAFARVALRAGRRAPVLVGTEHNVWTSHHPLTRTANRITLPLQRATLAVSEEVRSSMPPAQQRQTEVLVHGVDVDAIPARRAERVAAREELGLSRDDVAVVSVANLRANKDHETLLRAAQLLRDRAPVLRFLCVGQGPLADELEARRQELGVTDRFCFLGYQADPIRTLAAADVFCLPSRFEGLPIALLEALAVGLPIVATDVGGIPSAVRDHVEGLLVPPGDPARLAAALEAMVDPSRRERFGEAAAARAMAFGAQRAVDRQHDIYEAIASGRETAP